MRSGYDFQGAATIYHLKKLLDIHTPATNPVTMMKILVYASMESNFASRAIASYCSRDTTSINGTTRFSITVPADNCLKN
ncbi:MAG: hypothetical protein VB106_12900 [Clostridiaceae bacterium]|nr:hypothetical protein [Clostridiaceae bacterium]